VKDMTGNNNRSNQSNIFTQEQLNRNIQIFQLTGIDITVLIVPVIVLIWVNAKISFDEIIMLQGIFMLAIFLFEVPSGSLADYWSRKGSTALFHLMFGAGIFFYAIGNSFEMFAIAEFLAGVGITFKTGSDSALVYDSLLTRNDNPNGQFGRIMSNRMTLMFIGASVGALAGAILAVNGLLRLPIYITSLGHMGFVGVTYFGYSEPPRIQAKSPRVAIKTAVNSLLSKRELQLILVVLISVMVFTKIGFWAS
jgi:MFS family permease